MNENSIPLHYDITIIGRVQGVGFRYYTVQKAKELNIVGFVKNLRDRTVFIEAEGTEENLDHFILWCKKGPSFARVEKIKTVRGITKHYDNFSIKY